MAEHPNVTATEVAEWVFCQHAWLLRSDNAKLSDESLDRLAAGSDFQHQSDAVVIAAVASQAEARNAIRLAWCAGVALWLIVSLWVFFSLSPR
jgi:hypothetical protein